MSGLLDFLQAASNSAASNVSAPVDALAWLLRKAGIDVGTPVGGSDWMEQKGLTRKVPQSAASLAGETAGLLSPIVAAAKAPQIAKGLLQAGDNLAAPRTLDPQTGAIVWHGSPHKFDKFDSSKIGTGEGAQAYGHGLYVAENPGVAVGYKEKLAPSNLNWGNFVQPDDKSAAARVLKLFGGDGSRYRTKTGRELEDVIARMGGVRNKQLEQAHHMDAVWQFKDKSLIADGGGGWDIAAPLGEGNLYKIDLPDSAIAKMLDWDKPLSQQAPEVQAAVSKLGVSAEEAQFAPHTWTLKWDDRLQGYAAAPKMGGLVPLNTADKAQAARKMRDLAQEWFKTRGVGAVDQLTEKLGGPAKAADALRQQGIPGIRYLDGGSRGAGSGTSNYVVFPGGEDLLTILERNGIPVR